MFWIDFNFNSVDWAVELCFWFGWRWSNYTRSWKRNKKKNNVKFIHIYAYRSRRVWENINIKSFKRLLVLLLLLLLQRVVCILIVKLVSSFFGIFFSQRFIEIHFWKPSKVRLSAVFFSFKFVHLFVVERTILRRFALKLICRGYNCQLVIDCWSNLSIRTLAFWNCIRSF